MDRNMLLAGLALAEGEECLARQEALILQMERDGRDTIIAWLVLATLRENQALRGDDRKRILKELDE
jgi:hypothetical protein